MANAHGHNFHLTPCQPQARAVKVFNYYLWAEMLWKLIMYYGNIKKTDIANGTGVRVSLFVSGCRRHCKDCFNSETWDFCYGNEFTDDTMNEIITAMDKEYIKGFSLLGGEPFEKENRMAVQYILKTIKEHFPNKTVWCYSGFAFEELVGECEDILKYIDVLVDGAFVAEKKNLKLKFRGSENQRIINVKKSLEDKTVTELTEGEYDEY